MFNFGNGKTLIDLIPDDLSHAATSFVESLKINSITEKSRRDSSVLVKSRNPLRAMRCIQMLNGHRFRAKVINSRTVTLDKSPGHNLWEHMNRGTLTPRMLKAAGNEYRQRANQFCR